MANRRQQATRRLRCLLALAGDYLKYLFIRRRRLMHKVARKALALIHHHHHRGERKTNPWPRAILEYEFSCADSPSPAFLAAKRLLLRSRRLRSGAAGAPAGGAVAPSSCCFGSFRASSSPCRWGESRTMAAEEAPETTDDDDQALADDGYDEDDGWSRCGGELLDDDVDDRAEEFINMFYEQLRAQSFSAAVFGGSSP